MYSVSKKTAGKIAKDFLKLAGRLIDDQLRMECVELANEFKRLVDVRNGLIHGKPGTSSEQKQRLFRDGIPWEIDVIDKAADEFAVCDILLSDLHYKKLKQN